MTIPAECHDRPLRMTLPGDGEPTRGPPLVKASREPVHGCVDQTAERYCGLEVMVHNAVRGAAGVHQIADLDIDRWTGQSQTASVGEFLLRAE